MERGNRGSLRSQQLLENLHVPQYSTSKLLSSGKPNRAPVAPLSARKKKVKLAGGNGGPQQSRKSITTVKKNVYIARGSIDQNSKTRP